MGSTGSGRRKMWMLVGLLATGMLVQACSDNKGPAGPTFPAGQVGDSAGGTVSILLHPGPGADQFIVSVFVLSPNSKPAENRRVQLHTSAGSLNPTLGVTDHNGEFRSVLTCDGPATVTAFSEGVTHQVGACGGAYGASLFRRVHPIYVLLSSTLLIGLVLPQVVGRCGHRRRPQL